MCVSSKGDRRYGEKGDLVRLFELYYVETVRASRVLHGTGMLVDGGMAPEVVP